MKKILFVLMAVICLASCLEVKLDGKSLKNELKKELGDADDGGQRVERTLAVKPFEKIGVAGSYTVHFTQGDSVAVRVEGREQDLRLTDISSDGETLQIRAKNKLNSLKDVFGTSMKSVHVYVTSPDLIQVSFAGSGAFLSQGPLDTDDLHVKLAGSGNVKFSQVVADRLLVELAGSGDVDVESIDVNSADLQIAGSGDIDVHFVRADQVNAKVAGSGDIELSGSAKQVSKQVAGSGEVDTKHLATP